MTAEPLRIWVVYEHPTDYPDSYVARMWLNEKPSGSVVICPTLGMLRDHLLEMGLTPIDRDPKDDPKIVETWL